MTTKYANLITSNHDIKTNPYIAGWSSPVARQAHNLKVVGSNPTPATNNINGLALNTLGRLSFVEA